MSIEDVALHSLHLEDQEQIMGTASYVSPDCPPPFAAQFAEVEVDTGTGQVSVTKLVMAVDCGVAINPITASQVEGGMIQALGYAQWHEISGAGAASQIPHVETTPVSRPWFAAGSTVMLTGTAVFCASGSLFLIASVPA